MTGTVYLIPVSLGGDDFSKIIPEKVISLAKTLRFFVVEDVRSARRFLRQIDKEFPINDTVFFELNEHTGESEISHYLEPVLKGSDLGVMSEAGLPCIADPGNRIVALAHKMNIRVAPQSGPSSIILALIASGLNGQLFTFNGYLPVKPEEKSAKIRDLEKRSKDGCAQIFMETPYRNQKMFQTLTETCRNETRLCIAADISLPTEYIKTKTIAEWKKDVPSLNDRLVVYVLQ